MPKFNSTFNERHVNYNETRAAFGPSKDETLNLSAISSGGGARDRTYTNYADQMRSDTPKRGFQIFGDDNSSSRIATPKNESRQKGGLAMRSPPTPPYVAPREVSPQRRTPNNTYGGFNVGGWFAGSRENSPPGGSVLDESSHLYMPTGMENISTNYSSVFYKDGEGPPVSSNYTNRPMMYQSMPEQQVRRSPRSPPPPHPQVLSTSAPAGAAYQASPFPKYENVAFSPYRSRSPTPAAVSPRVAVGSPRAAPGSPIPQGPLQQNVSSPFSPRLMSSRVEDPNATENVRAGLPEHLKHLLLSKKGIQEKAREMAATGADPNSTAFMRNLLPDHFKHVIPSGKSFQERPTQSPAHPASMAARQSPVAARQSPVAPRQSPMSTTFSPMFPSLQPMAPRQSPMAPSQSPMIPRQSPMAPSQSPMVPRQSPMAPSQSPMIPRQSPMAPSQSPMIPRQSPMAPGQSPMAPNQAPMVPRPSPMAARQSPVTAPARAAPQAISPRRRSPDSLLNTTQYVNPEGQGATRFPQAASALPQLEFQLPPTILPMPGGQQAGAAQHSTSLPLAPQGAAAQRNVMSTSMPLPRREGRTTTERQVTGPQGTTRQTTVTTVDDQNKLEIRKQEFSKYCETKMQCFLQKHTKQMEAVIKGYKGDSQEELNGIINQLIRVQTEELNAFGEDMTAIYKALLNAFNNQVVRTQESKTTAPGQVITERTTVEAPAGPEDNNIADILRLDEVPAQDQSFNTEIGIRIANIVQQQNEALVELELVMKNEMEVNPTPETQRKNDLIIKEAKIEFKEALIGMLTEMREEYQTVKCPAIHDRLQQSKGGGGNDLASQMHQLLIRQVGDVEELKTKQQLMQDQNPDQDMKERHEMELQAMRDYHLAQLNEQWEKFQKGGSASKKTPMPTTMPTTIPAVHDATQHSLKESQFQPAITSSPASQNASGMQFQTMKQSESQQTSKQQLTSGKGIGIFTAHPVGSENCLCCSCQAKNSCSCGRGGGHGHGHGHGHGQGGGGKRNESGGGCNCRMFSDLDDIEMAEKEELHRSLKRWQLSRRDIVSSICKN